jgi:hypothetical protein
MPGAGLVIGRPARRLENAEESSVRSSAILVGFVIVALGLVGVVAPGVLVNLGRQSATSVGLYVVAAVRIVVGLLLIGASSSSRMPRTLRIVGIVALIAGLATPFLGVERARTIMEWWLSPGPVVVRAASLFALALGGFIIYALGSNRREPGGPDARP